MSVLLETSLGDLVIDLYTDQCPKATKNFLKLCKTKYYNNHIFHKVEKDFLAQTGDPTGTGKGGHSIYKDLYGDQATYFEDEIRPQLKHDSIGVVAMANVKTNLNGSAFYITLRQHLDYLDEKHTIFGQIAEGFDVLTKINEVFVDDDFRPLQNIRVKHTVILDDPFPDPPMLVVPGESPLPVPDQFDKDRIRDDENWEDEFKDMTAGQVEQLLAQRAAKSRAAVLEMLGDLPSQDVAPPDNVLFICKLNKVTTDEDLELIFSRFGTIVKCEVIRDWKTGASLNYAFIEFANTEATERAYFKVRYVKYLTYPL